ncbi:MAG TPA: response regulator [archaeon]|nr:response regulator [archaeon]
MAEPERKRILVVDDEPSVCDVYRDLLEAHGYQVDVAHGGRGAYRNSIETHYDLVHMDLRMPDWDGIDTTVAMSLVNPGLPVLVVSGILTEDLRKELEGCGNVRDVMAKPTNPEEYLATVKRLVGD